MSNSAGLLFSAAILLALAPAAAGQQSGITIKYSGSPGRSTVLAAGDTATFPDTALSTTSQIVVTATNSGNTSLSIASVTSTGLDFQLSGQPVPGTVVAATASVTFTISFTPAAAGTRTGSFLVVAGGTQYGFALAGIGIGPTLAFSYTVGSVTNTIQNNSVIVVSPAAVGDVSIAHIVITNNGTGQGTVTSIGLSNSAQFSLAGLPNLPAPIDAGASTSFDVLFRPNNTGVFSAILRVDAQSFSMSGVATAPAALPAYKFETDTATPDAYQQPAIGLTLAAPYALALRGTLTLSFTSSVFASDPAVQFSTGGKSVNFTVPANTTEALFTNNATSVRLQTGTVAGTLKVIPSFATDGGYDLTPSAPLSLTWTIAESAPVVLSAQVVNSTNTGFTLQVAGFATSRTLSGMTFQFAPAPGSTAQAATVNVDASAAFAAWYGSTASQQFGSLFTASVPFTLQGGQSNTNLVSQFQSVSVTLTNSVGTSAAVSESFTP